MIKICLLGLTGSGKSSIVNSLTGKRVSQTGYHNTTKEIEITGEKDPNVNFNAIFRSIPIITDDGVNICMIEVPGFEIEDSNPVSEKQIYEVLDESDVVYWVTDFKSAFKTSREIREFERVIYYAKKKEDIGIKIYLEIILSKFTSYEDSSETKEDSDENIEIDEITEELSVNILDEIEENYPSLKVKKFNSHGRSIRNSASKTLRNFILKRDTNPESRYTEFFLGFDHKEFYKNKQNSIESRVEELINCDFDAIKYINMLTDKENITNLFTFLTKHESRAKTCLNYFLESNKNIFENVKLDNMEYCNAPACFLIGLDNFDGLRLFYSNIDLICSEIDMKFEEIVDKILGDVKNKTKINIFREMVDLDTNFNQHDLRRVPNYCTKSWIESVEKYRKKLYQNDDDIDVRSLVQYKSMVCGKFISMFS